MSVVGEAFVAIRATAATLEKDIVSVVKKAATNAEKAAQITPKVNTAKAEQETKKLTGTLGALQAKFKNVAEEGGAVSSRLAGIAESATSLGPASIVAGLGLAALVGVVAIGVEKFFTLAEQVHKFQLVTSASAEDASRFVVALRLLGIEPDRVAGGLFRLTRQLQSGKSGLLDYNVQIATTKSGSVDLVATFLNIADAVHNATNETDQQSIAFAAFGKQGLALLPVLARGREGLQALFAEADKSGELLHQEDVEKAVEMQIEVRKLKEQINGLQVEAGKGGIPILQTGLKGLSYVVTGVHDAFYYGAKGINNLKEGVTDLVAAQYGLEPALHHSGNAAKDLAADMEFAAQKAAYLGTLQDDLQAKTLSYVGAQHSLRDANTGVEDANQGLADAQDRYNTLLSHGAVDAKAVRSAQESLTSSTKSLTSARESLADAERKLAEAQAGSSPRDLESADLHAREAANALAHAQQDLLALQKSHKTSALDLSDAQNRVEEATLASADAQDALTKAQQAGTDQDPDVIAAKKEVVKAHDGVAEAAAREKDAAANLREAQAGDPEFYKNLASAQRDVDHAKQGVVKATEAQATAVFGLASAEDAFTEAVGRDVGAIGNLVGYIGKLVETYHFDAKDILALLGPLTLPAPTATVAQPVFFGQVVAGIPEEKGKVSPRARLAGGGDAEAGYWYQVNEDGTEFFKPKNSGTVIPIGHEGSSAPGAGVKIEQHFHGSDPVTTAQQSGYYVGRAIRTAPR